jgi:hypothetical protein
MVFNSSLQHLYRSIFLSHLPSRCHHQLLEPFERDKVVNFKHGNYLVSIVGVNLTVPVEDTLKVA